MKQLPREYDCPRILITGACRGLGNACAESLADRACQLILCDKDSKSLSEATQRFGSASAFVCDVASDASVRAMADEVLARFPSLDMVINAAGGGYERTLGMYRVSRALLPALGRADHGLLVNIPPSPDEAETPIFPYASSRHAFHRLSSALAFEARWSPVSVMIACPARQRVKQVVPDPNAGTWAENFELRRPTPEDMVGLAAQIAALVEGNSAARRRAG